MKVLLAFGTRPEAIKMAPLVREIKRCKSLKLSICVTAQHREMLDQILEFYEIRPDYDLSIMRPGQDLFQVTARVLCEMKPVLEKEKPDIVLVQGDTTTAFAVSLAAYYLQMRVGHVEAGLRTYDKYRPFPEEINRHLIGVLADYHFAPTELARQRLLQEGVPEGNVFLTGNTIVDALFFTAKKIKKTGVILDVLKGIDLKKNKLLLVTGHRRESFGEGFENICHALRDVVRRNKDIEIIYPVHLNPNVRRPVNKILGNNDRIHLIEPLDYIHFVYLMMHSYLILTDSGGVQEEAPSLGKPVLVMREVTERPEAVEGGTAKLVGTDRERIIEETERLIQDTNAYECMRKRHNPFGDGKAAQRIVRIIRKLPESLLIDG